MEEVHQTVRVPTIPDRKCLDCWCQNCAFVFTTLQFTRTSLDWDSRRSRRWCTGRDVVYRPMHILDITNWKKSCPWHSRPVTIITTKTTIGSTNSNVTVLKGNETSPNDTVRDEYHLCRVARHILWTAHTQATLRGSFKKLDSWQLRPTEILLNAGAHDDKSFNRSSSWNAVLRLDCQFDGKTREFTKISDSGRCFECSHMHCTGHEHEHL